MLLEKELEPGPFDLFLHPSGSIGRTTSGKVQRALTKTRYERGALAGDAPDQAESYA